MSMVCVAEKYLLSNFFLMSKGGETLSTQALIHRWNSDGANSGNTRGVIIEDLL